MDRSGLTKMKKSVKALYSSGSSEYLRPAIVTFMCKKTTSRNNEVGILKERKEKKKGKIIHRLSR